MSFLVWLWRFALLWLCSCFCVHFYFFQCSGAFSPCCRGSVQLSVIVEFPDNAHFYQFLNREPYMSAHVLLNLLNELGKRKKARLASHFISFSQQV